MTALTELLAVVARLRAVDGCPWDREQTSASLAVYAIEEAYELADAAERGDLRHLQAELGDLLFQVVFHAQIADEAGHFDFDAVAAAIRDKLVRRHPHVFAAAAALNLTEQCAAWEAIKAAERSGAAGPADAPGPGAGAGLLDDVPRSLPALMRTHKLGKRAAGAGFDFTEARGAADKVAEELAEVLAAAGEGPGAGRATRVFEETGDLLFAAANLARKLGVEPEAALRAANAKFERRVRRMEALAHERGGDFAALDGAAQEMLWRETKRGE
ncbi:MAG TPA: nucleoside triphosphate pyrophosphohydrolase [Steroidobacteraceae bacterium]|nr:nucleoside triphosphate pyrophosphohydrolase [Steroidobacteraceae bacterium]